MLVNSVENSEQTEMGNIPKVGSPERPVRKNNGISKKVHGTRPRRLMNF